MLRRELDLLCSFRCRCLVGLEGAHLDGDGGTAVLVLEYMDRGSLADMMAGGPVPDGTVAAAGYQVLWGLSFLHREGVLHRDVKVRVRAAFAERKRKIGEGATYFLEISVPRATERSPSTFLTRSSSLFRPQTSRVAKMKKTSRPTSWSRRRGASSSPTSEYPPPGRTSRSTTPS